MTRYEEIRNPKKLSIAAKAGGVAAAATVVITALAPHAADAAHFIGERIDSSSQLSPQQKQLHSPELPQQVISGNTPADFSNTQFMAVKVKTDEKVWNQLNDGVTKDVQMASDRLSDQLGDQAGTGVLPIESFNLDDETTKLELANGTLTELPLGPK